MGLSSIDLIRLIQVCLVDAKSLTNFLSSEEDIKEDRFAPLQVRNMEMKLDYLLTEVKEIEKRIK